MASIFRLLLAAVLLLSLLASPVTVFASNYAGAHPSTGWPPRPVATPSNRPADIPFMPLPTLPPIASPAPTPSPSPNEQQPGERFPERALTRREQGMDIRGFIPVVYDVFGLSHLHIDAHIEDAVTQMIDEARSARARSITFSHYVYQTEVVVSVVIYATVSSVISRTFVQSVNFDPVDGLILTVNEAMGMDALSLAERVLSERIRRDPARYYAALSVSLDDPAFYMTTDKLVLLFNEFQLSTTRGGVDSIVLMHDNIRHAVVASGSYYFRQGGYHLQMVPLRDILERQLRYHVSYFRGQYGMSTYVMQVNVRRGPQTIISMRPHFNEYTVFGMGTMQRTLSLEAAPEIRNGAVYVPITFFNQVLPLTTYSVDTFGTITFLSYVG